MKKSRADLEQCKETLKDPDPDVRARAAQRLSDLEDPAAIESLIGVLKEDADRRVRWRAAYALGEFGEIGFHEAFEALVEHLRVEEDWNVRRIIVMALRHWDDRAVAPLMDALSDPESYVRRYAAMTLGFKKSRDALLHLDRLSQEDESKEVRDYSRWAAEKIRKSLVNSKVNKS